MPVMLLLFTWDTATAASPSSADNKRIVFIDLAPRSREYITRRGEEFRRFL
jgi:hypothetical protein